MGLDIALGIVILIAAVRGWFRGFMLQAIGMGALVACVYLADPIRDFARPHAMDYLPSIKPELLDRLLWWVAAASAFFLISGVGKWILTAARRRPYAVEAEPNRGDQGAGFLLGGLKGAVVASFLAAALLRHAPEYLKAGGYVQEQVAESRALAWARQYRPADQIWNSQPVQSFVAHVRSRGFWDESLDPKAKKESKAAESSTASSNSAEPKEAPPEPPPIRTAERPRTLQVPRVTDTPLDPTTDDFIQQLDEILKRDGLLKSR